MQIDLNSSWSLEPPNKLGPIWIGDARSAVIQLLGMPRSMGVSRDFGGGSSDLYLNGAVHINFDLDEKVTMCTVWNGGPEVVLDRVNIFEAKKEDLASEFSKRGWQLSCLKVKSDAWFLLDQNVALDWDRANLNWVCVFRRGIYGEGRFVRL